MAAATNDGKSWGENRKLHELYRKDPGKILTVAGEAAGDAGLIYSEVYEDAICEGLNEFAEKQGVELNCTPAVWRRFRYDHDIVYCRRSKKASKCKPAKRLEMPDISAKRHNNASRKVTSTKIPRKILDAFEGPSDTVVIEQNDTHMVVQDNGRRYLCRILEVK